MRKVKDHSDHRLNKQLRYLSLRYNSEINSVLKIHIDETISSSFFFQFDLNSCPEILQSSEDFYELYIKSFNEKRSLATVCQLILNAGSLAYQGSNQYVNGHMLKELLSIFYDMTVYALSHNIYVNSEKYLSIFGLNEKKTNKYIIRIIESLPEFVPAAKAKQLARCITENIVFTHDIPDEFLRIAFTPLRVNKIFPLVSYSMHYDANDYRCTTTETTVHLREKSFFIDCNGLLIEFILSYPLYHKKNTRDSYLYNVIVCFNVNHSKNIAEWNELCELYRVLKETQTNNYDYDWSYVGDEISLAIPYASGGKVILRISSYEICLQQTDFLYFREHFIKTMERNDVTAFMRKMRHLFGDL